MLFLLLGLVLDVAAIVCYFIVLIDMFKNEVWKGIVGLFCGLYWLYYSITEYESDNKAIILLVAILGGLIGNVLIKIGGAATGHPTG